MKRCVSRVFPVLSLILAGAVHAYSQGDYREQSLDLLRLLAEPWGRGHRWDRPRYHADLDYRNWEPAPTARQMDGLDEQIRVASTKRSAVATALNGRRRRQPASAPGKAHTPYAGVGIINDLDSFLSVFRENVDTLGVGPDRDTALYDDQPAVVQAPASGGGGGTGMRRLHALRPLRPAGNIRSFVEPETVYPGANHHDPGLLWTGLG